MLVVYLSKNRLESDSTTLEVVRNAPPTEGDFYREKADTKQEN